MEKENYVSRFKKTAAGLLAGINMMIPSGGLASSKETTSEDLKPSTSVSDVVIKENKSEELEKLEEMEVNQRFSDFLNGEGEYSDEKIKRKMMYRDNKLVDLGLYGTALGYSCMVQGVLLHCQGGDESQYLALGVKDRVGERKIVTVKWPSELLSEVGLLRVGVKDGNMEKDLYFDSEEEAVKHLMGLTGEVFRFSFVCDHITEAVDEKYSDYKAYLESTIPINNDFLSGLLFPDKKDLTTDDIKIFDKIKKINTNLVEINSLAGMHAYVESKNDIPVTFALTCNDVNN